MKSIQTKIICLIVIGITVSASVIGGISTYRFRKAMEKECIDIMNMTCYEKAEELNIVLDRVEQSVSILAEYTLDNLVGVEQLSDDSEYCLKYTKELDDLGLTIANETEGAIAVYVRFNPDITSPKAGFFRSIVSEEGTYESIDPTDLSLYDRNDIEHVGWYYIPVEAEKAIWMQPYYNKNLEIYMISYVIPVYKESQLIGVVGMDIDFNYIIQKIDEISIYDTGHAFVTDERFVIIHSEHYPQGTHVSSLSTELADAIETELLSSKTLYSYSHKGKSQKVVFSILSNGMYLAVTAPVSEIYQNANNLVVQVIIVALCSVLIFLAITIVMTKNIVKPLKALNVAAKEIANGNLDISFECKSQDEVGMLTKSLKETAKQLKIRIDYINNLAYLDKLTGIKNNTAYLREISIIKEEINRDRCEFAVFLVDINGLKKINDTYGHDYGNELIISVSKLIKECFGCEEIYRIGGDEFVVLMRGIEKEKCDDLKCKFDSMLKAGKGKIQVSAAIGAAVYEKNIDESYESVFRRADMDMYKKKEQMKINGEDSKVNFEYQN